MANLPSPNNNISWHLSDRALFSIASSSPRSSNPRSQSQALSSLTTSALTAYDSASRLGLGLPQRIMIEPRSERPILLHSYLNPRPTSWPLPNQSQSLENGRTIVDSTREDLRPLSGGTDNSVGLMVNGLPYGNAEREGEGEEEEGEEAAVQRPPLLVATVVAQSSAHLSEARRAAAGIERFGRQFQRDWETQLEEGHTDDAATVVEDG